MAESKGNVITYGMSGTMSKLVVFRSRLGRTFVSGCPRPSTKPPSNEQLVRRSRFAEAVTYAKAAIKNPEVKAMYAAIASPFQSAFNVAITDYLSGPDIKDIDTAAYNGAVGSKIRIKAIDSCQVTSIHVAIKSNNGAIIEEGDAFPSMSDLYWDYTATKANSDLTGNFINVTAYDLSGNAGASEKFL